jgi:hypothetical protein
LLPGFVHQVTGFIFEHSPGRRQDRFLNDGTAFDLAISVITPEGEDGTIFVEVKYSEDMTGPAARLRDRYDEASRAVGLFVEGRLMSAPYRLDRGLLVETFRHFRECGCGRDECQVLWPVPGRSRTSSQRSCIQSMPGISAVSCSTTRG